MELKSSFVDTKLSSAAVFGYSAGIGENIMRPGTCFDMSIVATQQIEKAFRAGIKTLCFVGSSCMYPVDAPQPYDERYLGCGQVEPTSQAHAYANLAAYAQCLAYTQQYGVNYFTAIQGDVYGDLTSTHFIAGIMQRMHFAKESNHKEIFIWGSGTVKREPIFKDDITRAIDFLLDRHTGECVQGVYPWCPKGQAINIGTGKEYSIAEIAMMIQDVVEFKGCLVFDVSKPEGAKRKALSNKRLLSLGFDSFTDLRAGLEKTYKSLSST